VKMGPMLFVCHSNAEHRGLLSEVSMVMCVDVVSDQTTDRTSLLNPDVTARAMAREMAKHLHSCRKSTTWYRRLYFPSEGSGAPDFLPPRSTSPYVN
jgi:hypothetical protein